MKKLSLIAFVLTAMMTACKSSDDNVESTNNNFVKKVYVTTDIYNTNKTDSKTFYYNSTSTYKYNKENKVSTINTNETYLDIIHYETIDAKPVRTNHIEKQYTYENTLGLLIQENIKTNNTSIVKTFQYNNSNQLIAITESDKKTLYHYNTKNQVESIQTIYTNLKGINSTRNFKYDQSNNIVSIQYDTELRSTTFTLTYSKEKSQYIGHQLNYALHERIMEVTKPIIQDEYSNLFDNLEYTYKGENLIETISTLRLSDPLYKFEAMVLETKPYYYVRSSPGALQPTYKVISTY